MIRNLLFISRQFGFDPIRFLSAIRFLPRYLLELGTYLYKSRELSPISITPTLNDYKDSAGNASGHYFWQDLITAKWIFDAKPTQHLDIASRIDGFVAHVATFMPIQVLDIRHLDSAIPNVTFRQANLQESNALKGEKFESVSCLHAIEHFGLGRYGDKIDFNGHEVGLLNIANLVSKGGRFYLSFPVGTSKTEFNAQRILNPTWAVDLLREFELVQSVLIPWNGPPTYNVNLNEVNIKTKGQAILMDLRKK